MNPEEPSDLSEADEARIRALLAAAKHDEPMPDAVVARLDRVLAGLAEEPVAERPLADVVPLAERRRRATRMLVAAAAVVLVGIGVGQVVDNGSGSGADAGSAPTSGDSNLVKGTDDREFAASDGGGVANAPEPQPQDQPRDLTAYKVRPEHFAADSRRVQRRAMKVVNTDSLSGERADLGCRAGSWGSGRYVPVEYGRAPGYLVLRRHSGDSQVADLFLCGSDDPVRSITLPGP